MVGLCRLCASLRKMDALINIKNESNEICEKLRKCCQLDIKMADALPKSICSDCIEKLNNYHNFYTKVNEAQDTLKSLFCTSDILVENDQATKAKPPSIIQSLNLRNEKADQCPSEEMQIKRKHCKANGELSETPSKHIKIGHYLLGKTKDIVKESLADRNSTKDRQVEEDVKHEMFIIEMPKEKSFSERSNKEIESLEKTINDLIEKESTDYFNSPETCEQQQQLIDENHELEEQNEENILDVLNEDDLVSDDVAKQINDNEINLNIEYMEYYEEEEDEDELESNQKGSNEPFDISSTAAQLKLSSWKNYKFLCFICDTIFCNFIDLKGHMLQEHNTEQINNLHYKCYDCKKVIPRYNFFLNHVRSKHHHELKLKCDVCDLSCRNFQDLSHHRNENCAEAINHAHTVACDQCFKSFHNVYGLQNHIKYQHNSSKPRVKYACTECNKEFQYKSCLKSHQQVHTGIKKFSCNYCDRAFNSKFGLEQHLYVHVNEKTYQCNICSKSYKTFQSLDEHQKLHTDEKTFKCQFCEKCFTQKVQKLTHERVHTGEMPFPCEQCDKRFRYSSALFAHSKVHSGHKPYSCEYCVKTFADSSNRNKHVRRMHLNTKSQQK